MDSARKAQKVSIIETPYRFPGRALGKTNRTGERPVFLPEHVPTPKQRPITMFRNPQHIPIIVSDLYPYTVRKYGYWVKKVEGHITSLGLVCSEEYAEKVRKAYTRW